MKANNTGTSRLSWAGSLFIAILVTALSVMIMNALVIYIFAWYQMGMVLGVGQAIKVVKFLEPDIQILILSLSGLISVLIGSDLGNFIFTYLRRLRN
jgi:hypothetical protein